MKTFRLTRAIQGLVMTGLILVMPLAVSAQGFATKVQQGMNAAASPAGLDKSPDLLTIIGNVIRFALTLVGVIFFGYFLYAGFLYLTSAGSKDAVSKAKEIMKTTSIGLVIVVLAYAISNFVLRAIMDSIIKG